MDIVKILGSGIQGFRDLSMLMDTYGIILIDIVENKDVDILKDPPDPLYAIRFSIPEKWEGEWFVDPNPNDKVSELKHDFKEQMNKALVELWASDESNGDESYLKDCTRYMQYMCKVRKGEVWTVDKAKEAQAKSQNAFNEIDKYVKDQQNQGDYEEV